MRAKTHWQCSSFLNSIKSVYDKGIILIFSSCNCLCEQIPRNIKSHCDLLFDPQMPQVFANLIRHMENKKSSCVNARGIPPAWGRKMLTPSPTPPLDLTSPPAGPDPPLCWTWPGWIDFWPDPSWIDLWPDPPSWVDLWPWPPPAGWTWPPPPGVDKVKALPSPSFGCGR